MFHLVSVWLTRIVVVGVLIALGVMYGPTWLENATRATPPAPGLTDRAAPLAPVEKTAGAPTTADQAAAPDADKPAAAASFRRCQPLGRTTRGELVYSMDCRPASAE